MILEAFQELTEGDKLTFPAEYLAYVDVFAKSRADVLPQHRKWDIALRPSQSGGPFTIFPRKKWKLSKAI